MTPTETNLDRDQVNILLVDDRHENLVALTAILNDPKFRIVTALSGAQALSCLLKDEFAVVILDVMMPEMDGYQVATYMKERESTQHIPIIFLTAMATDVSHIYKGYSVGAVDYLLKPLDSDIVKAKVAVFVDLYRAKQRVKQQADILREVERREQEAQLAYQRKESDAWYSTTLKSIGDAIIATDIQGMVRFLNPEAETLTGWSLSDANGKPIKTIFKILNETTRAEMESPAIRVMREGAIVGLGNHTVLIRKDGKEFLLEDSGAPIRDEKGVLLGVVIVFRDVTEKRHELARKSFLSKASRILLSSLDYSSTLDGVAHLAASSIVDGFIIDVVLNNGTIERIAVALHDPAKEGVLKKAPNSPVIPLIQQVFREGKSIVINDLTDFHLQSFFSTSDGIKTAKELGFRACVCTPLLLRERQLGVFTALRASAEPNFSPADVQMLEELASRAATAIENSHLYDGAQKAIRLRDEFLSIASHELRTPITPIKLQLQTLKNIASKRGIASYPKEKLDQMFTIADKQMERFQKLVEELLDVSRISAGRLKLEKQEVDLVTLVNDIVDQFADEIKKANCQVEINAAPTWGNWDKLRIEQVLINLLGNAMKFGAGKPINITVETIGDSARMKIQDSGPGISTSDQPRIFSRFERASSAQYFPGLGLGLYITRQILEAHGGTIRVESKLGHGATFIVDLPKSFAVRHP